MINLEMVESEIERMELECDTTYRVCQRLSWLYTVRENLRRKRMAEGVTEEMQGSEFLRACSGVSYVSLMRVLDDHVSALSVTQPRVYEGLLEKIRALR